MTLRSFWFCFITLLMTLPALPLRAQEVVVNTDASAIFDASWRARGGVHNGPAARGLTSTGMGYSD